MDIRTCEKQIKEFIESCYECTFIGKAEVFKNYDFYTLRLVLNTDYAPINLSYQGSIEDFLKYVKRQLKEMRLDRVYYYLGYKTDVETNE